MFKKQNCLQEDLFIILRIPYSALRRAGPIADCVLEFGDESCATYMAPVDFGVSSVERYLYCHKKGIDF